MENQDFERTDLAVEFTDTGKCISHSRGIKRTDVELDGVLAKKLGRAPGTYITVESAAVKRGEKHEYEKLSKELSKALSSLVKTDNCLIAALGNPNMTADALGKCVAERLMVTRHLKEAKNMPKISCICPNVLGVTGIESFDIIKGAADRVMPECIIVIDSLAGAATSRLASAFQFSNAGITPGSGVSNHRVRFDRESLGVSVVSIGVPLVVYASTIISDALKNEAHKSGYDEEIASLIVTPKDIDTYVEDCARIIAGAINLCFFGDSFCV